MRVRPSWMSSPWVARIGAVLTSAPRAAAIATVLGVFLTVGLPGPAAAHAGLVSSSPADGSRIAESPRAITLRFNEDVPADLAIVSLLGPGDPSALEVVADGSTGIRALLSGEETGQVRVSYRVTSADGHPIAGEISFEIVQPAQPEEQPGRPAAGSGEDPGQQDSDLQEPADDDSANGASQAPSGEGAGSGGLLVGLGVSAGFALLLAILVGVVVLTRRAAGGSPR